MKALPLLVALSVALQAQFRTQTDAVSVEVSVMSGTRPVAGLTSADFTLTDNGVPQAIVSLSIDAVPLDITVLVDAGKHLNKTIDRHRLQAAASARRVLSLLAADHRVSMVRFSGDWHDIADVHPDQGREPELERVPTGGYSTADYLALTLMRRGAEDRRRLVILFTVNLTSDANAAQPARLLEIARRFDGVVHIVEFCRQIYPRPGAPCHRVDDRLPETAEATGGQLHQANSPDRVGEMFARIVDSFRKSYVLRYTPQGVAREGWHAIEVTVTRPRGNRYTVRARKGYWWDDVRPPILPAASGPGR